MITSLFTLIVCTIVGAILIARTIIVGIYIIVSRLMKYIKQIINN
jgi:hypothetical protein